MRQTCISTVLLLNLMLLIVQQDLASQSEIYRWDFEETETTLAVDFPWDFVVIDEDQSESFYDGHEGPSGPSTWVLADVSRYKDSSNLAVSATSYHSPIGIASNWLITPAIDLSDFTHTALSFKYKMTNDRWPDGFRVLVSTSGQNIADFTDVLLETGSGCYDNTSSAVESPFWDCNCNPDCPEDWSLNWGTIFESLEQYAGEEIYIAIHHNANDQLDLLIDDITVFEVACELSLELEEITDGITVASVHGSSGPLELVWENQDTEELIESNEPFQESLSIGNWLVTVDDEVGCTQTGSIFIESTDIETPPPHDFCEGAIDLSGFIPDEIGDYTNTPVFNNLDASAGEGMVTEFSDCFDLSDLERTMWFTFLGDGNNYILKAREDVTGTAETISELAFGLYSGDCATLTALYCSQSEIILETEVDQRYYIIVGGGSSHFSLTTSRVPNCSDIDATFTTIDEHTCLNDQMVVEFLGSPIVPVTRGANGFIWAVSFEPLNSELQNPTDNLSFFTYAQSFDPSANDFFLTNDGDPVGHGVYYFTLIVYGNSELLSNGLPNFEIGCVAYGESVKANLYAELAELEGSLGYDPATQTITPSISGGSGSYGYAWNLGQDSPSIEVQSSGPYSLTVEDFSSCLDENEITLTVDIVFLGLEDLPDNEYAIFPNPTNGQLNITCSGTGCTIDSYQILDLDGRMLHSGSLDSGGGASSIFVNDLPSGMYILQLITTDDLLIRERFTVTY